ncbi:hypothetical protein L5M51_14190 [Shewanella sp. SM73]|uniref:hypothetical protein n=1 Tax=Shewanella TaxID=22 RepID=UPI0021D912D3|nr:hypothetical protein [Shewanella sp. SM73]MCU8030899.1 hypothetical protein [Shewanella sp. SM73]
MKKYIYLDWNVIQYMKHEKVVEGRFDAIKFKSFMQSLKGKYVFPASEGHLKDLAATFKKENWSFIEEDLSFLKEISEGLMLGVLSNETLMPVKADINEEFNKIINEREIEPEFTTEGGSYQVDMDKLSRESLFRPFLEKSNGMLDANVMNSVLQMMWDSMDDPDIYKSLRKEVESLHKTVPNQDTIMNKQSPYFKRMEDFFNIGKINDLEELKEKFEEIQSSFLAIDGRCLEHLTKGQKIQNAYSLLDFSPLFRDKINKKNRPSNMHRDLNNLFFASDAKYYVTEDEATYKKSKFVARSLGLPVRVVKMDELRLGFTCL